MTEHSIEELERQYRDAHDVAVSAQNRAYDARDTYHKALIAKATADFEAAGHKLGVTRVREAGLNLSRGNFPNMKTGPFVIVGFETKAYRDEARPIFRKITKAGKVSSAPCNAGYYGYIVLPEDNQ
jgi:hypothetical protein